MRTATYSGDVSDMQVQWGGHADPRGVLRPGKTYEVSHIEVHTHHTKVFLKGFPGLSFNSVWFNLDISADIAAWKPGMHEDDI